MNNRAATSTSDASKAHEHVTLTKKSEPPISRKASQQHDESTRRVQDRPSIHAGINHDGYRRSQFVPSAHRGVTRLIVSHSPLDQSTTATEPVTDLPKGERPSKPTFQSSRWDPRKTRTSNYYTPKEYDSPTSYKKQPLYQLFRESLAKHASSCETDKALGSYHDNCIYEYFFPELLICAVTIRSFILPPLDFYLFKPCDACHVCNYNHTFSHGFDCVAHVFLYMN